MTYYAHSSDFADKESWQLLKDHLEEVGRLAEERAAKFGAGKLGRIVGLAHDLGKYSEEFQRRLEGDRGKVDHSTAGAKEVYCRYPRIGYALAYVVAGHHGGLPDGNKGAPGNLPERLARQGIPAYRAYADEIGIPGLVNQELADMPTAKDAAMRAFSFAFCIRMLYSCLVDADYLDTERFMDRERFMARPVPVPLTVLLERLEKKLAELAERTPPTAINTARKAILGRCLAMAEAAPGFFTLTVPTGGGKTYSSLAFGLKHAVKYGKARIIYVIPYTSIIEQNAEVFREALAGTQDEEVVLEHHSNFEYPEGPFDEWDKSEKANRLAAENWDMPVVVTTAVQFFESLYANKGSRCRKLHNMVNSVIVLDEAQMMPLEHMKPCLWALTELVLNYGATVVLCTATQPAVGRLIPAGPSPLEIMENPEELQKIFKRVTVQYGGEMSDEELAAAMSAQGQVLTIVNTRRHARVLFDLLLDRTLEGVYHLSARMCPAHRKIVLAEIRRALKEGRPCRAVSTQLIEAGVDVDFPVVYRSVAGVDSIAQAAGRCNREGRRGDGRVVVFEPEPHGMPKQGGFSAAAGMTRSTIRRLDQLGGELLSLAAIEDYFRQLLDLERDNLDAREILEAIAEGREDMSFPFAKIANDFQMIDGMTVPVVVPFDERAQQLMEAAERHPFPAGRARSLQPYVVQIYNYEMAALEKAGAIRVVGGFLKFLTDRGFYDSRFGLKEGKEVKVPSDVLIF